MRCARPDGSEIVTVTPDRRTLAVPGPLPRDGRLAIRNMLAAAGRDTLGLSPAVLGDYFGLKPRRLRDVVKDGRRVAELIGVELAR